ncbi:MAG: hypothetical protein IIZ61_09165 [Lachnospiraceae bacterium]|nr:hypothetical protein [Lachnospiraceae bacterium]
MFHDVNIQTIFALDLALILQLLGVALVALVDPYIKKENKSRFYIIIACVTFLLVEPQISEAFGDVLYKSNPIFFYTFISAIDYIIRPIVIVLFIRIAGIEKGKTILYIMLGVNAFVNSMAFFNHWVFFYDDTLHWHRGPLGWVSFAISGILDLWLVVGAALKYRGLRKREAIVPTLISISVVIAVILDVELYFSPRVSFLTVAMTEASVFLYIWLHLQFVREHDEA